MGTKHTLLAGALLAAALCLFAPAVGAEDTKTVGSWPDDGYTVTIPSTVSFAEGDKTQKLEITGTLGKYRTLDVTVASKNNYALKYASDPNNSSLPSLSYTLKGDAFDSTQTGKQTLSYITDADENNPIKTTLNAEIQTPLDTATMSGSYTDNLTFTFDCKKKTQECEITVKYESMDTTASGEITKRERNSQWESETHTFKETLNLGEEHTFELEELFDKNSSVKYAVKSSTDENKNAWEFGEKAMLDPTTHQYTTRTYSITPTPDKTNYEIKVYRKMVWLDLNYIIYDSEDKTNPLRHENVKYGAEYGDKNIAMMEITVNGVENSNKRDYWEMHPYGSTFSMTNIRKGNVEEFKNYEIYGYYVGRVSTGGSVDLNDTDLYVFKETDTIKSTVDQTLTDQYKSSGTGYSGDYSKAVYIILRPYTVTIQYETMASYNNVSSPSDKKRYSSFDNSENKVVKGLKVGEKTTYSITDYNNYMNVDYWLESSIDVTPVAGTYDYTIQFLRKMCAFDLNVAVQTGSATAGYKYDKIGVSSAWGTAKLTISGTTIQNRSVYDYYTAHPYGAKVTVDDIQIDPNYEVVGYSMNYCPRNTNDTSSTNRAELLDFPSDGKIEATLNEETGKTFSEFGVTQAVEIWIVVKASDTKNEFIDDEEVIIPATTTPTAPATDDTATSDTDDVTDDDPAADTDDTPTTPGDDDDITPDDADDTTDTPSDADDADDADTDMDDTDDTEPADDPTDEPDADDGDVEDTDAAGDDVLDDEPDDGNADAETATEPLDILA